MNYYYKQQSQLKNSISKINIKFKVYKQTVCHMSYFKDENRNPLDHYGLRQPAIKQQLMPSYQNISKPTRDISANHRSHSLHKQQLPISSNSRVIILERKIIQLQKQLQQCDFQRQANIVYNKQFRQLGRLLGDENMQFDQIRGKIQDMILQDPLQTKFTYSQTNLNNNQKQVSVLRQQIANLKFQLNSQRSFKQTLIHKIEKYRLYEEENITLKHQIQDLKRQFQTSNVKQRFQSNSSAQTFYNRSRQGQQEKNSNYLLIAELKRKDSEIQQRDIKIRELLHKIQRNQYRIAQKDNIESNTSIRYKQLQRKYEIYLNEYEKLEEKLKQYEYKIHQNELAFQNYQQKQKQILILSKSYAQMQQKLQNSIRYQSKAKQQNQQAKYKIHQYESKINNLSTEIHHLKTQLQQKSYQLQQTSFQLQQKSYQLQTKIDQLSIKSYQLSQKTNELQKYKQDLKQQHNQIIKLGAHISKLSEDIVVYQRNQRQLNNKYSQLNSTSQNSDEANSLKLQNSKLKQEIYTLNTTINQQTSQLNKTKTQLQETIHLLQQKSRQLLMFQTQYTQLKQSLTSLNDQNSKLNKLVQEKKILYEQKNIQTIQLSKKYKQIQEKNEILQKQRILTLTSNKLNGTNIQQYNNVNSQLFKSNNLVEQNNQQKSMQRIQNVISNVNYNQNQYSPTSNSIMRTGEFVVNNTISNSHSSFVRQEYKYQINSVNNKQNISSIERSSVQYKLVNFNANHESNDSGQQRNMQNSQVNNYTDQVEQQRLYIQQLVIKINYLQSQLKIMRNNSDSKDKQVLSLQIKIQQLQSQIIELKKKLDSHHLHQSSSRQHAKQYSGNFGGNQTIQNLQLNVHEHYNYQVEVSSRNNAQSHNQIQAISQLTKKSCVQEQQNKRAVQQQLSGSSFKYYQKKSQYNNGQSNQQQNSIYGKTQSIQNGTKKITQQIIIKSTQQNKRQVRQNSNHDKDDLSQRILNQHENQSMSEHSLSKLVMGENHIHHVSKQSKSKIQNSSIEGRQIKKQITKNRSIHQKINDISVDKGSQNSNQLQNHIHNVPYDLPQYSRKPNQQIQMAANNINHKKQESQQHSNTISNQVKTIENQLQSNNQETKKKSQIYISTTVIQQKTFIQNNIQNNHLRIQHNQNLNVNPPLSTIISNSQSVNDNTKNSVIRDKRDLSSSSISNARHNSPSPGRISITYGRQSKIIYTGNQRNRQNSVSNTSQDRIGILPIVSSKQVFGVNQVVRRSAIVQNNQTVYNQNKFRTSIMASDNNATVRPSTRSNSRQNNVYSRFRSPNSKLTKQDIQRQTLVNDQYIPAKMYATFKPVNSPTNNNMYQSFRPSSKYQQSRVYQNSGQNSIRQSIHMSNPSAIKSVKVDQTFCCGISPAHSPQPQQYKKSNYSNSQLSRFNVVKQSKISNSEINKNAQVQNYRSSFADRIENNQSHINKIGQSTLINRNHDTQIDQNKTIKQSFYEHANNISMTESQDSGINVYQNANQTGFNCCSG